MTDKKQSKKVPRGRKGDSIEDLHEDGAVGSDGWKTFRTKKQPKDESKKEPEETQYPTVEEVVEVNKYITTGQANLPPAVKKDIDKMFAWCKPRDPARIEKVLDALKELWLTQPDQRLGQLLENYVFTQGPRDKTTVFLFYQEDDLTLNNIKAKIEETREREKGKQPKP